MGNYIKVGGRFVNMKDLIKQKNSSSRDELIEQYTELFGKAPNGNIKDSTLTKKIKEKQEENSGTEA